jgi:5-(carboxyamino)imidazole ribonucleotide synthase
MVVLAERPDDAACEVAAEVVIGSPLVEADMRALAARCDVITFDHELVDLSILEKLVADGIPVHPGVSTLGVAINKGHMRRVLAQAGVSIPAHAVIGLDSGEAGPGDQAVAEVGAFAQKHGWPIVLKATRGGYDGKGVWPVGDLDEARRVLSQLGDEVLVEEMVAMRAELAVMVARRPSGISVAWPAVETAQVGGVCREVLVPGRIPSGIMQQASEVGLRVAEIVDAVGVLAVELFWTTDGRLLVNEIAARPHNSGHWTIEGAVTSQFENHVRAVLDLPLGATAPQHDHVASVNIFGGPGGEDPVTLLADGLAVEGAHIHLYGKEGRPGRKLGHVTVAGIDEGDVRSRAWAAALALGTPRPDRVELPEGLG